MSSATDFATQFLFPNLGDSVQEGTITRWLKSVGDRVIEGEPLVEVATDKVDSEIVATATGVLTEIHVREGETAAVGQVLASISGDDVTADTPLPVAPVAEVIAPIAPVSPDPPRAAEPNQGERTEQLSGIRRVIGERMMHSLATTAQLTSVVEIDVTRVIQARERGKAAGSAASYFAYFARAALDAIEAHPLINTTVNESGTQLTFYDSVALGIAVDSPRGLMVPVVRNAQNKDARELSEAIAGVAVRVREGAITSDELSSGTFTLTNTGSRGALFDTPILNSPQSAILGTGAIVRRVVPIEPDFRIGVRSFAHFSLTYDHRVIDGADAARYLTELKRLLEAGPLLGL